MSWENLLITQLPRDLTDVDLMNIFAEYHPKSAKMMLDTSSGKSKGFGFVLFSSWEVGREAYYNMNQKFVDYEERTFPLVIYPSKHDGNIANEPNRALYIRNIPITVPQEEVLKFLGTFGSVTKYNMRSVKQKNSMVWAVFAEYSTLEEAKSALSLIHGSMKYFGTEIALLAKFADTEDTKKARRLRREQEKKALLDRPQIPGNPSQGIVEPPQPSFNGVVDGARVAVAPNSGLFSIHTVPYSSTPPGVPFLSPVLINPVPPGSEATYYWPHFTVGQPLSPSFSSTPATAMPFLAPQASGLAHQGALQIQGAFPYFTSQVMLAAPQNPAPALPSPAFSSLPSSFVHMVPATPAFESRKFVASIDTSCDSLPFALS